MLEFIAALVGILAWPVTILIVALILRFGTPLEAYRRWRNDRRARKARLAWIRD